MSQLETIIIQRATTTVDEYGDTIEGSYSTHLTFQGRFAPKSVAEPVEVGRNATELAARVLIRNLYSQPDILPTDRVLARGVAYEIDGEPEFWSRNHTNGVQIVLKSIKD